MPRIAFEEISPRKGYPNFDAYIQELEKTLDGVVKPELLSAFEEIVANWEHKPDFRARKVVTAEGVAVYVYPTGSNKAIWEWVSGGVRAHTIVSKAAGVPMRFRTGYKPRTWTGLGRGYGGPGTSVGPWVSKHSVDHPGINAREFEKKISILYQPKFRRRMFRAARLGAWRL